MKARLLAIGDVHGCIDPLRELIEERIIPEKTDRLVMLGDYIDRGPAIREVADYLMKLIEDGYDIIPLLGNHEAMMIDSPAGELANYNWHVNGGSGTLESFEAASYGDIDQKYRTFFERMGYYHMQDGFVFVHAGFNDDLDDPLGDRFQMLWSRRDRYSNPFFADKVIVHGHTPVPLEVCRAGAGERVINIDTGCVYNHLEGYGYLSAIELKTRELFTVYNRRFSLVSIY